MRKRTIFVLLATLTVLLVSVGLITADGPIEGRPGRAEVRFLEGMIDHHQMALDMANDCLPKASTEDVKTLCQNILDAQSAEITTMEGWLLNWYSIQYAPAPLSSQSMPNMDHGTMQMGDNAPVTDPAMTMGMMAGLGRVQGKDYDIAFLEAMIDHHDDAVHMSNRILERDPDGVGHTELRDLAQKIVTDQTAEIQKMEALLISLGD